MPCPAVCAQPHPLLVSLLPGVAFIILGSQAPDGVTVVVMGVVRNRDLHRARGTPCLCRCCWPQSSRVLWLPLAQWALQGPNNLNQSAQQLLMDTAAGLKGGGI